MKRDLAIAPVSTALPAPGDALLEVQGLTLVAPARGLTLVDDLSFCISAGEFLAVVGESGSGKTLAARAVLGLLPPGVERRAGRIVLDAQDLAQASPAQLRAQRGARIGMVFQEPMVSLNPALSIGAQMDEGLRLHTRLRATERRERCLAMLERIQIRDPARCLKAFAHEFSGGMRQRIMLASVMLLAPRLLIADEPTTALDTLTQREVLDLMVELAREQGTAVLLITHNLGLVARYAQRALVMEKGRVVEQGPTRQVLFAPRSAYTRTLVDALPRRGTEPGATPDGPALLEVRALSVSYPGPRKGLFGRHAPQRALDGVDLVLRAGETVAVVGGSGSGKTTLGRAMLRLAASDGGEIRFRGEDIRRAAPHALRGFRLACQLVFQDPYSSLDPRQRVGAIVEEPLRLVDGLEAAARRARTDAMLAEVGLAGFGARFPHELSGGQRQRVAIARALVRRPALVVADEPVSALDMTIQAQVLRLFKALQRQHGFACLFISHDLAAVEQIADRVVVMQGGRIVEEGSRDRIFDAPQHDYTRALLAATPAFAATAEVETSSG
jgi:peptide/nickel transport system ATP-binding protein